MDIAQLGFAFDSSQAERMVKALESLAGSARKTETATEKMNREIEDSEKRMMGADRAGKMLTRTLKRLGGVMVAALSVRQVQQYADTWSDMSSRIQVSIGAHENAADVMSRLSGIARMTYSSLESTAESFAQNSTTLRALGKTTQEQLDYTEALNNALVVSGAKGHRAQLVQDSLSRAMAEGTLRGQELNNVLNYGSRIAEALADELGVDITQLRGLAAEGKIAGGVIFQTMTKIREDVARAAESMPATISDAFVLMRNAALEMIGVYDQAGSLSESLAGALVAVADNLAAVAKVMLSVAAGWVTYQIAVNGTAIALAAARTAQLAFNAAAMINPYVAIAATAVAAVSAIWMFRDATIGAGEDQARLKDYAKSAWDEMGGLARDFGSWISSLWPQITEDASGAYSTVTSGFNRMVQMIVDRAYSMANTLITVFVGVAKTGVITAQTYIDTFLGVFNKVIAYAKAFGVDMKSALSGDFGFSAIREEMEKEVEIPLLAMPGRIADAWKDAAATDWLGDLASGISNLGDRIAEGAQKAYALETALDDLVGKSKLFGFSVDSAAGGVNDLTDAQKKLQSAFEQTLDQYRRQLLLTESATESEQLLYEIQYGRLKGLIPDQQQMLKGLAQEVDFRAAVAKEAKQLGDALRERRAIEHELSAFQSQSRLEIDTMGMGAVRRRQMEEELRIRSDYAQKRVALEEAQAAASTRLETTAYESRLAAFAWAEAEKLRILQESANLRAQAEGSLTAGMSEALQNYVDEAQNKYQLAADAMTSLLGAATSSVSDNLYDMIVNAKSAGEALQGVAASMATAFIRAITDMIAKEMVLIAVQRLRGVEAETTAGIEIAAIAKTTAASLAATAKTVAAQIGAAASTFAAWLPAAIASSIGSFGTAAAIGLAAVTAAIAFKGFRDGGYTGNMGINDVAGFVHGREFVFDAAATSRIGVDNLEALRSGRGLPTSEGALGVLSAAPPGGSTAMDATLERINRELDAITSRFGGIGEPVSSGRGIAALGAAPAPTSNHQAQEAPIQIDMKISNSGMPKQVDAQVQQVGDRQYILNVMMEDAESGSPSSVFGRFARRHGIGRVGD